MAAARYWRIVGIRPRSDTLTLGALELFDAAGRVDAGATISSSVAPVSGALAALSDGDDTTTCSFASDFAAAPGFSIVWDFGPGAGVDVIQIRICGGPDSAQFLDALEIHGLTAGQWQLAQAFEWVPAPGPGGLILRVFGFDYNAAVLASSPVAFWPLDETSGTVAAELVAGRNGVRGGGALVSPGLLPGSPAAFDPAGTGLISVPSSTAFDLTTFTLEFWIKTTTVENLVILERNGNAGVSVQTTGNIPAGGLWTTHSLGVSASGGAVAGANLPVNTGAPVHCVVRVQPSGVSIYLDAQARGTFFLPVSPVYGGAPFFIGSRAGAFGMPAGSAIGKVALYNRLLTEVEIASHFVSYLKNYEPLRVRASFDAACVAAQSDVPPHGTLDTAPLRQARDVEFGGAGHIYGTTKIKGTPNLPTKARVRLLRDRDALLARETWSDPATGAFDFPGIDTSQKFTALAADVNGDFRPVAANQLTPEVPA